MEEYGLDTMENATKVLRILNDPLASDLVKHLESNKIVDLRELSEQFGPAIYHYIPRLRNTCIVSTHGKLIMANRKLLKNISDFLESFSLYLAIFEGTRKVSPALVIILHMAKQPYTYSSLRRKSGLQSSTFNRYVKALIDLKIIEKKLNRLYVLSDLGLNIQNSLLKILSVIEKRTTTTQPIVPSQKTRDDLQLLNVVRSLIKYFYHPLRLGIVRLLITGDMCFEELSLYLTQFVRPLPPTRVVPIPRKRHPTKILRWHLNILLNAGFVEESTGRYSLTKIGEQVTNSLGTLFQLDPNEIQASFPFSLSEEEKRILIELAHPRRWVGRRLRGSISDSYSETTRTLKEKSLIRRGYYYEEWILTSLGRIVVDLLQLSF